MGSVHKKWAPATTRLLTAVTAPAVGVAMVFRTRGALAREREFRAARPCASVPVEVSECRWEQRFAVRSADTHSGSRSQSPEAVLTLPSGEPRSVAGEAVTSASGAPGADDRASPADGAASAAA